jgi:hypothetical protein
MDLKKILFFVSISAIGLMLATGNLFRDPEKAREELQRLNQLPPNALTKRERQYKQYWTFNAWIFKVGWKVAIVSGISFVLLLISGN